MGTLEQARADLALIEDMVATNADDISGVELAEARSRVLDIIAEQEDDMSTATNVAHIACEQTYSGTRGTVTVWCYCGHSAEGIDLHDAKRKHVLHLDGINVSA